MAFKMSDASRTTLEHKTPESNKSETRLFLDQALFAERFEQSVFCLRVIHDGDLGGQVVG
jgi:hypothetical protein